MSNKKKEIDKLDLRDYLAHGDQAKIKSITGFCRKRVTEVLESGPFDHQIRIVAYKIIQERIDQLEEVIGKIDELTKKGLAEKIKSSSAA